MQTVFEPTVHYHATYKPLSPMKEGSSRGLFGNGAANHHRPLVTRQSKTILPGVESFDPQVLEFIRQLSYSLNDACPVSLDKAGFTRTGVHSSFDRLRVPAGYMMNPMSYVAVDNQDYIRHLGLRDKLDSTDEAIGRELWHLIFSAYKPSPIKVTKNSAGGARRNTSDHKWKQDYGQYVLQPDVLSRVLDAHSRGDWLTLANEFEMVFMTYAQKRDQTDTPGKVREVMDLDYALSGGRRGAIHPADKDVIIDGRVYSDFSASRARFVHAGPWAANVILSMVSTGTMQAMFDSFPLTFHVNTAADIGALVEGCDVFAGDVTEYDRSMNKRAIELPHEVAREYWDPRIIDMSEHLYFSAYYARPLELDGDTGTMVGDYTSFEPQVVCGNRSGHAWTSLIAKVNKVWDTLIVLHKCGHNVLGNVKAYLEHRGPVRVINNGDDEVVFSESSEMMDRFRTVRSDLKSGLYVVKPEDGAVYSGLVLRKPDPDVFHYEPCSRLATAFEKIYVPERSIGGLMRPYWWIGVTQRINARDEHPAGGVAWEVHDRLYRDMMEPRFGSMYQLLTEAMQRMPFDVSDCSNAEREVLDDPTKLHYKYKDGQIRDEIVELSTIKIAPESFMQSVLQYYTGNITH